MTDVERARQYIAIFINAGDRWLYYVPLDADLVTKDSVRIGSCEVGPGEGGKWFLKDLTAGTTSWYQQAVTS
jgi:hypothetical protein